jgi:uncharacterized protein
MATVHCYATGCGQRHKTKVWAADQASIAAAKESAICAGWSEDRAGRMWCPKHTLRRVSVADDNAGTPVRVRIRLEDLVTITQRVITPQGYLVAPARIGRTGLQEYTAKELGLDKDGVPSNKVIRLYRPADEVFSPATIASFEGTPVTIGHPPSGVDAENWQKLARGEARDIRADGNFLAGQVTVRAKAAVADVVNGKSQLSCGYEFDLDMTPGRTADGQDYDGVQRNITGNHIAIVDYGRAGPGCRIADSQARKETTMKIKIKDAAGKVLHIEVADEATGQLLEDAVDGHHKALMAAKDEYHAMKSACDDKQRRIDELELEGGKAKKKAGDDAARIATLEGEITALKGVDHQAIADERNALIASAKTILGADFDAKGKTNDAIRALAVEKAAEKSAPAKAVVGAVIGTTKIGDAKPEHVKMAFDTIVGLGPTAAPRDAAQDARDRETAAALAGKGRSSAGDGRPSSEHLAGEAAIRARMGAPVKASA